MVPGPVNDSTAPYGYTFTISARLNLAPRAAGLIRTIKTQYIPALPNQPLIVPKSLRETDSQN